MAFATLAILEIVLGIDNIVFLAILTGKLPHEQQPAAANAGPAAGRGRTRRAAVGHLVGHHARPDDALRTALGPARRSRRHKPSSSAAATTPISLKDLVLLLGGCFCWPRATWEIGHQLEHPRTPREKPNR